MNHRDADMFCQAMFDSLDHGIGVEIDEGELAAEVLAGG